MTKQNKLERLRSKLGMLKSNASGKGAHRSGKVEVAEEGVSVREVAPPLELGSLAPDLTPREGMTTGQRLEAINWGRSPVTTSTEATSSGPEPTWTVARRLEAINWGRQVMTRSTAGAADEVESQETMTVDSFFSNANW